MPRPDPTHHACPRCGAITEGTDVPKHDREHDKFDKLEQAVQRLADAGVGVLELEPWPSEPQAAEPQYGAHL